MYAKDIADQIVRDARMKQMKNENKIVDLLITFVRNVEGLDAKAIKGLDAKAQANVVTLLNRVVVHLQLHFLAYVVAKPVSKYDDVIRSYAVALAGALFTTDLPKLEFTAYEIKHIRPDLTVQCMDHAELIAGLIGVRAGHVNHLPWSEEAAVSHLETLMANTQGTTTRLSSSSTVVKLLGLVSERLTAFYSKAQDKAAQHVQFEVYWARVKQMTEDAARDAEDAAQTQPARLTLSQQGRNGNKGNQVFEIFKPNGKFSFKHLLLKKMFIKLFFNKLFNI